MNNIWILNIVIPVLLMVVYDLLKKILITIFPRLMRRNAIRYAKDVASYIRDINEGIIIFSFFMDLSAIVMFAIFAAILGSTLFLYSNIVLYTKEVCDGLILCNNDWGKSSIILVFTALQMLSTFAIFKYSRSYILMISTIYKNKKVVRKIEGILFRYSSDLPIVYEGLFREYFAERMVAPKSALATVAPQPNTPPTSAQ